MHAKAAIYEKSLLKQSEERPLSDVNEYQV